MAKKSVKLGLRSGSAVESGDVNVTYNGVRIAGLYESTIATLQTENTIVEHVIEIEYTKPAGGGGTITVPLYGVNTQFEPVYEKDITITVGEPHTETKNGASSVWLAYNGNALMDGPGDHSASHIPANITETSVTFLGIDPSKWEIEYDGNTVACNSILIIAPR